MSPGFRVAFIHPDLGIGGAERLVVDAAVGLKELGHSVDVFTAHHDPNHCFEPTRDGTLNVHVYGDWMPRAIAGRFHAVFAVLRTIWCTLALLVLYRGKIDVVFADQVSASIPLLHWAGLKVLFYCHFPDRLLSGSRAFALKRWYRAPLDWLEEETTGAADAILVNSHFTAATFRDAFPSILKTPKVLYPAIDFEKYDVPPTAAAMDALKQYDCVLLSINRYERKKNLPLAIECLSELKAMLPAQTFRRVHLIIAGGFDERVTENQEVLQELESEAEQRGLQEHVTFDKSFDDDRRAALFEKATCVLYTPEFEHFGIVPIEAMYCGTPVVACRSGGPLESVVEGETGFLCEPSGHAFAAAVLPLINDPGLSKRVGDAGREHVIANHSLGALARKLEQQLAALVSRRQR